MSREPRDARATQVLSRYWKNPSAAAENGRNASNRGKRDAGDGHSDAEIQAHAALFRSNIGNTDFTHNCVMLTQIL
jgi:hypothetical protein